MFKISLVLIAADFIGLTGIAASNRSTVKPFDSHAAYDDYYDLAVDTGDIGDEQFATRVQIMLVAYLRAQYGDGPADCCERYWTGDRGYYDIIAFYYIIGFDFEIMIDIITMTS